jgi:Kef-type K+ transport system membrane component KefB
MLVPVKTWLWILGGGLALALLGTITDVHRSQVVGLAMASVGAVAVIAISIARSIRTGSDRQT